MALLREGQCGMCVHFGEDNPNDQPKLVQIRAIREAPDDLIERCGLPENAQRHLRVTPVSGCDGFARAETTQFDAETTPQQ